MDAQDLANSLFGKDRLEERELQEISTVNATAVSDSSNGYVKVRINEARTSSSNSEDEDSDVIELPTTPNVKEGDEVIVTCEGDTLKVMRVTDNIGSGDRAQTATDDARKVATNYIDIDENNGIIVGNMTDETLGKNSYIDANGFYVRDGETALASFEDDEIKLGQKSQTGSLDFCNNGFNITVEKVDATKYSTGSRTSTLRIPNGAYISFSYWTPSEQIVGGGTENHNIKAYCTSFTLLTSTARRGVLKQDTASYVFSPTGLTKDGVSVSYVGHTHKTSDLTDVDTLAKVEHTHKKADITDFTHTHLKSDITDFDHTHTKADITDFTHNHAGEDLTPDTIDATSTIKQAGTQVSLEGHTHSASDVTSGTLEVARGGTGKTAGTFYGETVLYDNVAGTNSTVTLSESAENFTYLEIYYKFSAASRTNIKSVKVYSPNDNVVNLTDFYKGNTTPVWTFLSSACTINGTSITREKAVYIDSNQSTKTLVTGTSSVTGFYITRVVGYK